MADRIHPSSDDSGEFPPPPGYGQHHHHHHYSSSSDPSASPLFPYSSSDPPSGQFVVQLPRDQVYRVPPPENAHLLKSYARRAARRRRRSCFCALRLALAILLSVALLAAAAAAALFFALRPKLPSYSLLSLSARGLNLSSPSPSPSAPAFAAAIRARNPNGRIAIEYRRGSAVAVSYGAVNLADGVWPAFDQGPRNVTAFVTALRGAGVRLSPQMRSSMAAAERSGAVPLTLDASVPVRVRVGAVTTWTVTVKVRCGVAVDRLAPDSKVVSESCHVSVDLF